MKRWLNRFFVILVLVTAFKQEGVTSSMDGPAKLKTETDRLFDNFKAVVVKVGGEQRLLEEIDLSALPKVPGVMQPIIDVLSVYSKSGPASDDFRKIVLEGTKKLSAWAADLQKKGERVSFLNKWKGLFYDPKPFELELKTMLADLKKQHRDMVIFSGLISRTPAKQDEYLVLRPFMSKTVTYLTMLNTTVETAAGLLQKKLAKQAGGK